MTQSVTPIVTAGFCGVLLLLLSIQYLRAVAAIMVVVFHASDHVASFHDLPDVFGKGAAGVDIFFVISGFIMWYTTANGDSTASDFLWRRLARIAPLYWLATLLMFTMPAISGTIAGGLPFDPAHLLASLLFLPYERMGDSGLYFPTYSPGWTINFEMFFYAVFAFCLFVNDRRLRLTLLVSILASIVVFGYATEPVGVIQWYSSPILIEFVLGALIAAYLVSGGSASRGVAIGILIAGVVGLALSDSHMSGSSARAYAWGGPAALIVLGAALLDRLGLVKEWARLKFLGDASYALYLSHLFAVGAVAVLWHKVIGWSSVGNGYLFMACAFIASLAVAAWVHVHVERRLLTLARDLGQRWSARGAPASAS